MTPGPHVTAEQIAAAQLRMVIDARQGRPTSKQVEWIAGARPGAIYPFETRTAEPPDLPQGEFAEASPETPDAAEAAEGEIHPEILVSRIDIERSTGEQQLLLARAVLATSAEAAMVGLTTSYTSALELAMSERDPDVVTEIASKFKSQMDSLRAQLEGVSNRLQDATEQYASRKDD